MTNYKNCNFASLWITLVFSLTSLQSRSQEPVLTLNVGHSDEINSIAYSPDGKYAVSAASKLKLWDIETGRLIRTFDDECRSAQFTPDGKYILAMVKSGDRSALVKVWDVISGESVRNIKSDDFTLSDLQISNDGKLLLTVSFSKKMSIWDFRSGKILRNIREGYEDIREAIITPDSRYIISLHESETYMKDRNEIRVWNLQTGELLNTINQKKARTICVSPNNTHLIVGYFDGTLGLYDFKKGKRIKRSKAFSNGVQSVDISPQDGKYIVTTTYGTAKIFNIESGDLVDSVLIRNSRNSKAKFSPNGKDILFKYLDHSLRSYDYLSGSSNRILRGMRGSIDVVKFSTDGKNVLSAGDGVRIWGRKFRVIDKRRNFASFSQDNRFIISGALGGLSKWDVSTGHEDSNIETVTISKLLYTESEKYAITENNRWGVDLWDLEKKSVLKTYKPPVKGSLSLLESLNLSDWNNQSATFLWNTFTGTDINKFSKEDDYIRSVDITADGQSIIIGGDVRRLSPYKHEVLVRLCNLKSGRIKTFKGHKWKVNSVSFSPDNTHFITGSDDRSVKLWNINDHQPVRTFLGHSNSVEAVSFSPNGELIISGSKDNTMKLWKAKSGELLGTFYLFGDEDWLVVTPSGQFDGTDGAMEQLYYVKGLDVLPLSSFYEKFYTPRLVSILLSEEELISTVESNFNFALPPTIEVLNPISGSKLDNNQVTVAIRAVDQGGGIDEIRLYHNGKLVNTTQRGFQSTGQTKTFTVNLVAGENRLKATAFNDQRTESTPDEIVVYYEGAKATADLFLVVIGINQYRNSTYNLNYALTDAAAFKNTLESGASSIFSNISTTYIRDTDATKSRIINALNNIKSQAGPEDMFVFYYAGHGVMNEGIDYEKDFYLVPYNVTKLYAADDMLAQKAISSKEITELSRSIAAQKQLFVLDACQSGGALQQVASRGAAEEKAIAQLARSTGTYWLTASGSEQFATEFQQLGHGVFTYAILEGLKGNADSGDQKITAKELGAFIEDKVPELTEQYRGQAQFPRSYGFGQDFPLVIVK